MSEPKNTPEWERFFAWIPVMLPQSEQGNGPGWLRWLERRVWLKSPSVFDEPGAYKIEYRIPRR